MLEKLGIKAPLFKIQVKADPDAMPWYTNIVTLVVTIIASCCCCLLVAALIRCYVNHQIDSIDFNRPEPDPNWDEDILRVYYIRRLQRQIEELQMADIANRGQIEEQIR